MKTAKYILLFGAFFFLGNATASAQATCLPLIEIDSFEYQGAFIIPGATYGESNANYTDGTIEYNPVNHSLFLAGHRVHGGLAEFAIPALVNSTVVVDLNTAAILQDFRLIMEETPDGNPQNQDRIAGLKYHNSKLIVNTVEYYDAPANNTHTSLVIEDASDIANSALSGYYALEGRAHAAGWMSPIPTEWQTLLGGEWITCNSSRYPINSRLPMGISAFVFDPDSLNGTPAGTIPTTTLLDYNLSDPLYADYPSYASAHYNLIEVNGSTHSGHTFEDADAIVGDNDLWTSESSADYGLIIPGTRTYLTVGHSGGHNSGIGYKATQSNGNLCGGPCPYDSEDYYSYYWLWDVNDLLDVKNGVSDPYDVRPYAYGVFDVPFQYDLYNDTTEIHPVVGGTYDPVSKLIYLTIYDGASTGAYDRIPIIAAYKVKSYQMEIQAIQPSDSLFTGVDTIATSGLVTITNGNTIIFEAANMVILNPEFTTELGSDFTARIGINGCNPAAPYAPTIINGGKSGTPAKNQHREKGVKAMNDVFFKKN